MDPVGVSPGIGPDGPKNKKKKKKSFVQKAKKFGKRGRFGQGREIDRETYDYFVRVMENHRAGEFDDKEAEGEKRK